MIQAGIFQYAKDDILSQPYEPDAGYATTHTLSTRRKTCKTGKYSKIGSLLVMTQELTNQHWRIVSRVCDIQGFMAVLALASI